MPLALLFPGQGSQEVGMGRKLSASYPEAARIFQEADDTLGFSLSRIMWEGPEEQLVLTANAQPAILVHSVAVLRVVQNHLGPISMAAGHSLGEFTAHVAAGTMDFADALQAVRRRGELMLEAGKLRPGSMAALLSLDEEQVGVVCRAASTGDSIVVTANLNSPGQVVISGDEAAVERALPLAREAGARKALPLKVSGAFHSPLMDPAREGLRRQLAAVSFRRPAFPVVANVDGKPVYEPQRARDLLVEQLTAPVRWQDCVESMVAAGVDHFLELGPGSVLKGLNRRIARDVPTDSVGTSDEVEVLLRGAETAGAAGSASV